MATQLKFFSLLTTFTLLFNQNKSIRTILIFADKANNPYVMNQLSILTSDPSGIKDRDIVFKIISYSTANVPQYQKWHVSANSTFTVLLIGKDDGEKLRSHEPIPLAKLYDLIDNMPMRQQEIHYKHK